MFKTLFLKEWKERYQLLLFSTGIILLFILAYLAFSGKSEARDYLVAAMVIFFPGILGWIIGASAWQSEHRDGAWAFLLSRPIQKWRIWVYKLVSLLTMAAAVFGLLLFIGLLLPGFYKLYFEFSFPLGWGRQISQLTSSVLISLCALFLAFALSSLSRNHTPTVLISIVVVLGIGMCISFLLNFEQYFYPHTLSMIWFLILSTSLSFLLASLLTYVKSDYLQERKQSWAFSRYVVVFFVVLTGLNLGIGYLTSLNRQVMNRTRVIGMDNHDLLFQSGRKMYVYDSETDSVRNSKASPPVSMGFGLYSIRKNKILFASHHSRGLVRELYVMDTEGFEMTKLLEFGYSVQDTDLFYLVSQLLSDDGSRAAFITTSKLARISNTFIVGAVSADGTGLRKHSLDIPGYNCRLVSWSRDRDVVYILLQPYAPSGNRLSRLIAYNLADGSYEVVLEKIIRPYYLGAAAPLNRIHYIQKFEETGQESLVYWDPEKDEKTTITRAGSLQVRNFLWNSDGSACVFSVDNRKENRWNLYLYSVEDARLRELKTLALTQSPLSFTLVYFDGPIVGISNPLVNKKQLTLFHIDTPREEKIDLPRIKNVYYELHSLPNKLILSQWRQKALWRLDLVSRDWKRIH